MIFFFFLKKRWLTKFILPEEWATSSYSQSEKGKEMEDILTDSQLWRKMEKYRNVIEASRWWKNKSPLLPHMVHIAETCGNRDVAGRIWLNWAECHILTFALLVIVLWWSHGWIKIELNSLKQRELCDGWGFEMKKKNKQLLPHKEQN